MKFFPKSGDPLQQELKRLELESIRAQRELEDLEKQLQETRSPGKRTMAPLQFEPEDDISRELDDQPERLVALRIQRDRDRTRFFILTGILILLSTLIVIVLTNLLSH